MTTWPCVYEFNEAGLIAFRKVFEGGLPESALDPLDPHFSARLPGSRPLDDGPALTSLEMAARVQKALPSDWRALLPRRGLWAWLTFVLRDTVLPRDRNGVRKVGELHRWYPSDPGDFQKAQRHLIRMPVVLLGSLNGAADHLLCGDPSVPGEVREQLTGRQDMLTRAFQGTARSLYYDEARGGLKRGAGGKGGGSARRLRDLHRQLDVTWDLFGLDSVAIQKLLPTEFDKFLPQNAPSPA